MVSFPIRNTYTWFLESRSLQPARQPERWENGRPDQDMYVYIYIYIYIYVHTYKRWENGVESGRLTGGGSQASSLGGTFIIIIIIIINMCIYIYIYIYMWYWIHIYIYIHTHMCVYYSSTVGHNHQIWYTADMFRKEPARFDSFQFRTFEKSSFRFGSVRFGSDNLISRFDATWFGLRFLDASWLGPVRFGSVRFSILFRPLPEMVLFGSVRLVRFGFLFLPAI